MSVGSFDDRKFVANILTISQIKGKVQRHLAGEGKEWDTAVTC
jgi:hypothetical protein